MSDSEHKQVPRQLKRRARFVCHCHGPSCEHSPIMPSTCVTKEESTAPASQTSNKVNGDSSGGGDNGIQSVQPSIVHFSSKVCASSPEREFDVTRSGLLRLQLGRHSIADSVQEEDFFLKKSETIMTNSAKFRTAMKAVESRDKETEKKLMDEARLLNIVEEDCIFASKTHRNMANLRKQLIDCTRLQNLTKTQSEYEKRQIVQHAEVMRAKSAKFDRKFEEEKIHLIKNLLLNYPVIRNMPLADRQFILQNQELVLEKVLPRMENDHHFKLEAIARETGKCYSSTSLDEAEDAGLRIAQPLRRATVPCVSYARRRSSNLPPVVRARSNSYAHPKKIAY